MVEHGLTRVEIGHRPRTVGLHRTDVWEVGAKRLKHLDKLSGKVLLSSKALAGYMTAASGRKLLIAIYLNNDVINTPADIAQQGKNVGRLCEIIYSSL